MEFSEWRSRAFEELHPVAKITQGEITLSSSSDLLVISWGAHTVEMPLSEFYSDTSENPLYEIKKWAYEALPSIPAEEDDTYVVYNPQRAVYDAYTLRCMGTYHVTKDVSPSLYQNYADVSKSKELISTEMNGTVICLETKDKRLPASFTVTEASVFKALIEQHMDYSDDLSILIPSTTNNHIFAGYRTAIERLQENFPLGTTLNTPAGEWFNNLTIKDEA